MSVKLHIKSAYGHPCFLLNRFRKYFPQTILILSVITSLCLHWDVFGYDLVGYHAWRQTQTQTVINNFCNIDFNIFNPRLNNLRYPDGVLRMEFPLYQWLAAGICKITGSPVLTTRIFSFVIGLFSSFGFYLLAKAVFKDRLIAAIGAWALMFSPVFYYYTVNPLPDNLGLCFGVFALYYFVLFYRSRRNLHFLIYAILLLFASLSKLPFILFGVHALVMWLRREITAMLFLLLGIILTPAIVWYALVIGTWGDDNEVASGVFAGGFDLFTYLDYLQHNFVSTLPELFINYSALVLFAAGVFFIFRKKVVAKRGLTLYFFAGLAAVIFYTLFELNMIAKVHDYYLFPYLPFLFLIVLFGFRELRAGQNKFMKVLAVVCVVCMPVTAFLRCNTRWNLESPGFNSTFLEKKDELRKLIPERAICLTGNDDSENINLYYLDRKGYAFWEDKIDSAMISGYVKKGVQYLVSDAQMSGETMKALPPPIAIFNDVKIYKLY